MLQKLQNLLFLYLNKIFGSYYNTLEKIKKDTFQKIKNSNLKRVL
jgi:hypothetical protein